jgi:hypothetical protein
MSDTEFRPGLGRVYAPDDRDQNYRLEAPPQAIEVPKAHKLWWEKGAWYDQGATGTCVGHGWAHEIEDGPVRHPTDVVDPFAIYDLATTLDPWPDNDHDLQAGTSVRAGAQAAQQMGYISQYSWAWDLVTVQNAVLTLGPVVFGLNWYNSMFDPMWDGDRAIIRLDTSSGIAGGHCVVLNGCNMDTGFFRLKNSWGQGWGDGGHGLIAFGDVEYLLAQEGEACMPTDAPVAAGV